jgi:hypothetical protein
MLRDTVQMHHIHECAKGWMMRDKSDQNEIEKLKNERQKKEE